MKRDPHTHRPRVTAAIIAAATLPLTPLVAQEAAPPAVQPTVAAPAAPAPSPAASPSTVFRPQQAVVQLTPPRPVVPVEAAAPAAAVEPAARRAVARPTPRRAEARASAPVRAIAVPAAAVVAAPVVAPTPATPSVAEITPAPVESAPVDTAPVDTGNIEAVSDSSVSTTPWLAIAAIAALATLVIGFLLRRRRQTTDEIAYSEASYVPTDETGAPVPEVDLAERPWIRLSLQPTRSETYNGEQTVDYQLIVENEGKIPAHDVRVSSFLTGVAGASPSDALRGEQSQTHHIDVAPGASVPLPGTVTTRDGSDPKIVADARYALPDGGEGHLAALFGIDTSNDEPEAQVEDVLERV